MATFFTLLLSILRVFLGGKRSDLVISVKDANQSAKASAEVSKQVSADNHKDLTRVENETNSDLERLRNADGLRERVEIARNAVKRANKEPGASD